jgi:restriction endonuclease Mrr
MADVPQRTPSDVDLGGGGDKTPLDDLAGRDLADAVAFLLNTFDRNGGQVALRQLAEGAQRRGRISGDLSQVQAQVAAAIRADNARRAANGQRIRFRFVGGRVALTDWLLGGELARLEAEAQAAVERYREASRRALLRKLQELPGHALVELVLLALDRAGLGQIRAVRRPGMPGGESHFSAVQRTAFGEVKTALVVRRDGREIGRERVADLRGSLHHYGPAVAGWMVTTGQVLSGAREESAAPDALPIALCDGMGLVRLCEENDVGVVRARMPIALPDVDLLEALRAT